MKKQRKADARAVNTSLSEEDAVWESTNRRNRDGER
jgi:hypothetical protein